MFKCSSCGLCCSDVRSMKKDGHDMPQIQKEIDLFPYKPKEDGSCENLGEDNICSTYDNRPTLCDVSGMYDKYPEIAESKEEWFKINNMGCNILIKKVGLDDSFLIKD